MTLGAFCAHAQEGATRILSIDVRVEGAESWQANASHEKATFAQRFTVVTELQQQGGLDNVNLLDPESVARRQRDATAAHAGMAQYQLQVNEAMKQAHDRCKGNEKCLADFVMKNPVIVTPPAPAVMAGRDDDEKGTYSHWYSAPGCAGVARVMRNDVASGAMSDVGGARPTKREVKVQAEKSAAGLCDAYTMTVIDEAAGKLYVPAFTAPSQGATRTSTGYGAGAVQAGEATLPPVVAQHVSRLLKGAPLAGSKTETLRLDKPLLVTPLGKGYAGSLQITVRWEFRKGTRNEVRLPA